MKDEDIPNLLGGFATGTLSVRERDLLFTAALKDQALFNALADEQVLHDFLSDPASRRQLIGLLQPETPGVFERLSTWIARPASWAAIGGVTALFVVAIALQQPGPRPVQMARAPSPPVAVPTQQLTGGPIPEEMRQDTFETARQKRQIAASPAKMKVAVLDFDSGPSRAREADSASADLGKTASDLLGKKLDSSLYDVIDRKQVDKAVQEQKLKERQFSPAAAASVGRSVGADAVIVGSVKASSEFRAKANKEEEVALTVTAINTLNAASLGSAQGNQAQVASSLNRQMQQSNRNRIEGAVTDVNATSITFNAGTKAGVKLGDLFEVRRAGRPIGRVVIKSAQESLSSGPFEGSEPVRLGDTVSSEAAQGVR